MQQATTFPSNAFSSLTIHGLVKGHQRSNVSLNLHRASSIPAKTVLFIKERDDIARPDGPPARPPSSLPPPGDLSLTISLQDRLGRGRVGCVYSVGLTDPQDSSQSRLPPLVIKVAARRRCKDLQREAWCYEEMELLQGVAIARCFGLFEAELDEGCEVLNWAESDARDKARDEEGIEEYSSEEDGSSSEEDGGSPWGFMFMKEYSSEEDSEEDGGLKKDKAVASKPDTTPRVSNIQATRTMVSVLVFERLGDLMPLNVSLESIEPDVYEVYYDIARLGMEHLDIRWSNILSAPVTRESPTCPYHGHPHDWRVVDFDRSRKTDMLPYNIDHCHKSWLRPIFLNLPLGCILEPWD